MDYEAFHLQRQKLCQITSHQTAGRTCTLYGPIEPPRADTGMTILYYYHFVGHCGAFCGLKWRINKPIKNENQIIVRSKQPIKIEKPFQSLLTFSHSAGEKNILQSVLLSFFSVFIFSMPSKAARAKMGLSRAQNIFMPANINSIVILRQLFESSLCTKETSKLNSNKDLR